MTETEVRNLRDKCYGVPCTDGTWNACRHKWMLPENIEWLKAHQEWPSQ